MGVGTLRRHYRNKVLAREFIGDETGAMVYQAKADALPGHALPLKFVNPRIRALLIEKGITTLDDLNGSTVVDIANLTGLGKAEAGKVRAAVEREVALRAEDRAQILADFPYQAALAEAGYTTEDSIAALDEADLAEIPGVAAVGARVIQAHRAGLLGVPFAENIPHLVRLSEVGVRAVEQLDRLDATDLVAYGLTEQEAAEVIAFRNAQPAQPTEPTGDTAPLDELPPPLEIDETLPASQQQPAEPTGDSSATAGTEGETASQVST